MSRSSLYDEDILLWSEQQAAAIRKLAERPSLVPNDLDIANVAEEIESVGRSELAAVESYLELILLHLIKLRAEPDAEAARHWRGEILGFHARMRRRYAPSMRQRIDLDALWRSARDQLIAAYVGCPQQDFIVALAAIPPFALDDFLGERLDSAALAKQLGGIAGSVGG